ncbi:MAG: LysM peptidoglycan-binding domain-containing protein, partial [Thermoguttaceae bacterium]
LIAFGVVLANRFKGTSDEPSTASSDDKEKPSPTAEPQTTKDTTLGRPALVADKPSLTGKDNGIPDTINQWNVVSDSDATGSTLPAQPPSSYMPNPQTTGTADPYDPYAGSSRYGNYTGTLQQQTPGVGTQAAGGASNPFYDRPAVASPQSPGTGVGGTTSRSFNVLRPSPTGPASSSSGIGGTPGPSTYPYNSPYSSGSSTLRSTPTTSQGLPYSPPAPTTSGSLYGPSAAPVSTYGGLDPRNENGEYEVQPNDSYWKISQKLYGSGAYFRALVEQNRDRIPREDRLAVGDLISAPTIAELEKAYPDLCPKPSRRAAVRNLARAAGMHSPYGGGPTYVVEEGDTLYDIARYELGKASRWSEIHALNSHILGKDYDYLVPGTRLTLPGSETADTLTNRPGNGSIYQR